MTYVLSAIIFALVIHAIIQHRRLKELSQFTSATSETLFDLSNRVSHNYDFCHVNFIDQAKAINEIIAEVNKMIEEADEEHEGMIKKAMQSFTHSLKTMHIKTSRGNMPIPVEVIIKTPK